jgi:uncharacterized RDD family membrane protein YckC
MQCEHCGQMNSNLASVCSSCGMPFNQVSRSYVGFWRRFVAYIIDGIILVIIGVVLGIAVGSLIVISRSWSFVDSSGYDCLWDLISLAIGIAYFAGFESSSAQATPGKAVMGAIVVDSDGNRISFGRAFLRYIGKILSVLILFLGMIMIGFTEKKQGLHDMIAGTYVIEK